MKRFFYSVFSKIFAVATAFLFSQLPAFMQQYTHILYGHLQECRRLRQAIDLHASFTNKTVPQYIQKFLTHTDPDFVYQGQLMADLSLRTDTLEIRYYELTTTSVWQKPFVFLAHLDGEIARETFDHFVVSITFSAETALFALSGILVAMGVTFAASRRLS